ncbi:MAG: hypothetical protein WB625_16840 [Candidatus Sulfotelmatobacter sp.]
MWADSLQLEASLLVSLPEVARSGPPSSAVALDVAQPAEQPLPSAA